MRCRHFANGLPAIKKSNLPFSYVLPLTIQLEREMNNLAEQSHRPPFNLQVIGKNYFKKYCSQNTCTYINLYLPLNRAKMLPDFPSIWPQRSLLVKSGFFFFFNTNWFAEKHLFEFYLSAVWIQFSVSLVLRRSGLSLFIHEATLCGAAPVTAWTLFVLLVLSLD